MAILHRLSLLGVGVAGLRPARNGEASAPP
jgi:hypothetical protein